MPLTLRTSVIVLGMQAAAGLFLAALMVKWLVEAPTGGTFGYVLIGFTVAYSAGLGYVGYALSQLRAGARGIAIALELLLTAPAANLISIGAIYGWVIVAACLLVVGLLVAPATGRALGVSS